MSAAADTGACPDVDMLMFLRSDDPRRQCNDASDDASSQLLHFQAKNGVILTDVLSQEKPKVLTK